jgi:hypothetical protein
MLAVAPNMTVTVAYDGKGFTDVVPNIDHSSSSSDTDTQQQQQQQEVSGMVLYSTYTVLHHACEVVETPVC